MDRAKPRGSYIYLEGEPAQRVWFVKRGCVVLTRATYEGGGESPHAVRRAGSFIGLEALVRDTYVDTARVTTDSILCGASREVMSSWMTRPAPLRMALDTVLRADCADAPRLCKADGSAMQRVARWILAELQLGVETVLPRRYIAGLLGLVPETLSRALTRLAKAGAIDVTRRTVRVRDLEALRGFAAADEPAGAPNV